jgi:DNA-directed RNA polymerase omega subunit
MEEKFPDRIDSKFRYVLVASARAEQIMRGARAKLEVATGKPTTIAMEEVTQEVVDWGYGPSPAEIEMAEAALEAAPDGEEAEEEVH